MHNGNCTRAVPGLSGDSEAMDVREIRSGYRQVLSNMHKNKEHLVDPENPLLHNVMETMDVLFTHISEPTETVMDAQAFKEVAAACKHQAMFATSGSNNFRVSEYVGQITSFLQGELKDDTGVIPAKGWIRFGRETVAGKSHRVPPLHYLYGSLDPNESEAKEVKVRAKPKVTVKRDLVQTKMKTVERADIEENMTKKMVDAALKKLQKEYERNGRKPISYFRLVLDPTDFGRSVENIFHISFLVKDFKAYLEIDEETELPVIYPASDDDVMGEVEETKRQTIIQITQADWASLVKLLNIKKPMLVHEEHGETSKRTR